MRPVDESESKPGRGALWVWLGIALWHFVVVPAAFATIDCVLGYGAYPRPWPPALDWTRHIYWFLGPLPLVIWIGWTVIEGGLCWAAFRLLTRRRVRLPGAFARAWLQTCLLGTPVILAGALAVGFGAGLAGYDLAMNLPLAWIILAPAVVATMVSRYPRWRPGGCVRCGYALEGNITGTCPECGASTATRR